MGRRNLWNILCGMHGQASRRYKVKREFAASEAESRVTTSHAFCPFRMWSESERIFGRRAESDTDQTQVHNTINNETTRLHPDYISNLRSRDFNFITL